MTPITALVLPNRTARKKAEMEEPFHKDYKRASDYVKDHEVWERHIAQLPVYHLSDDWPHDLVGSDIVGEVEWACKCKMYNIGSSEDAGKPCSHCKYPLVETLFPIAEQQEKGVDGLLQFTKDDFVLVVMSLHGCSKETVSMLADKMIEAGKINGAHPKQSNPSAHPEQQGKGEADHADMKDAAIAYATNSVADKQTWTAQIQLKYNGFIAGANWATLHPPKEDKLSIAIKYLRDEMAQLEKESTGKELVPFASSIIGYLLKLQRGAIDGEHPQSAPKELFTKEQVEGFAEWVSEQKEDRKIGWIRDWKEWRVTEKEGNPFITTSQLLEMYLSSIK